MTGKEGKTEESVVAVGHNKEARVCCTYSVFVLENQILCFSEIKLTTEKSGGNCRHQVDTNILLLPKCNIDPG